MRAWLIGSLVVLVVGAALWCVPKWQVQRWASSVPVAERPGLENEFRKTLAQLIGGGGLLFGLYLTWRRIATAEQNVELGREGQITERFTRAIEHLGDEKVQVRLGGIYALERIAVDSERDHWTVMEVLTAFVREQAPAPAPDEPPDETPPPTDVQACLDVLGRRQHREIETATLNLSRTDLRNSNLEEAHFEGVDLEEAHLEGANLWRAHFENAFLEEANLRQANLSGARFEGATFENAHAEEADFREAHAEEVNFKGAHMAGADFRGAYLEGAVFERANVLRADFRNAHLEEAVFDNANLEGARFEGGRD